MAGDVNAWIYVKAGTNWTPGFYKIDSVAGGSATVNATIGAAVQYDSSAQRWKANTVAGVATVASPTGGTCGIDYSQGTAAIITDTDLVVADGDAAAPTVTSVLKPFGVNHVGNLIHITAGVNWTAGWYEIVSVATVTATLDRACAIDGAVIAGTFYVGGAISLGAANDDAVFENTIAGNVWFMKQGTYTLGGTVTTSAAGSTTVAAHLEGFASLRGDRPVGSTRPTVVVGATTMTLGNNWKARNVIFQTVEGADTFVCLTLGTGCVVIDCKAINTASTAARAAFYVGTDSTLIRCEGICTLGRAVNTDGQVTIIDSYFHHSQTGIRLAATALSQHVIGCLVESCTGIGISFGSANTLNSLVMNCTIVGTVGAPIGTAGIFFTAGCTDERVINCIIMGYVTGVSHGTAGYTMGVDMFNSYYNNTTNATNWMIGHNSITSAIAFSNVLEVRGTAATTSGGVLTDAAASFSNVTDNQDYLYVASGTGVTARHYLITAHTATTVTLSPAPGDSAVADKVYRVTTGRNYSPTSSTLVDDGSPGAFPGGIQTSYKAIGAIQPAPDYPSADNVTSGVSYGFGTLTGTKVAGGGGSNGGRNSLGPSRIG